MQYIACVFVCIIGGILSAEPWWTSGNAFTRTSTHRTAKRTTLQWFTSSDGSSKSCQCSSPEYCRDFISLKASTDRVPACSNGQVCCQSLKQAASFDEDIDNVVLPTKVVDVDIGGEDDSESKPVGEDIDDTEEEDEEEEEDEKTEEQKPPIKKSQEDEDDSGVIDLDHLVGSGQDQIEEFKCGVATPVLIIDDKVASDSTSTKFGQFPWNLVLLYTESGTTIVSCGASLIQPSYAITAAHCIAEKNISKITIRAGEWDLNEEDEPFPCVERTIKSAVIHKRYQKFGLLNDIAFLVLSSPLTLSPHIGTICIPHETELVKNPCIATGWGMQGDIVSPSTQSKMKAVQVRLERAKNCETKLQRTDLGPEFKLSNTSLCATATKRGQDTSIGDGGGPLFCSSADEPSHFTLVGIVSWGKLQYPNAPGVYTAVKKYREWIDDQLMIAIGMD